MATLRTAIALYDGVTSPLQHMTTAMNVVINSFEKMQTASGHSIDTAALQTARSELARASTAFDSIENNIRQSDQQQQRFNSNIRSGTTAADGLLSKIKGIAATVGGIVGLQKTVNLSDTLAQTNARLSLIVDDGGSVEALQQKIMASANSARASYVDVGKTVSKLGILAGDAFSGNDEMVKFTELLNKNFVIGGAAAEEQSAAMYQLTQAMASGRLQGDEFRSIRENAPLLAKAIEDYMADAGVPGTLKDWSAQGLITADVIKNAMFQSADEVDARFAEMPMTWAQRWTLMKNDAILAFEPILTRLNEIANSERFQTVFNGTVNGLAAIASVATEVLDIMTMAGAWIIDNWSWIGPIVYAVAFALLFVAAVLPMITIAQWTLNSALFACPIVWIIAAILAAIVIVAYLIQWVAKLTGHTVSAAGIIAGVFAVLGAHIANTCIIPIWNIIAAFVNFIGNVFQHPLAAVSVLFFDLAKNVIGYIRVMAQAIENLINKIPGIEVNITSGLDSLYDTLEGASKKVKDKTGWVEYVQSKDYINYSDAAKAGYNWGSTLTDKFNLPTSTVFNDSSALGDTAANTADTAANTAAMKDSLASSEEHLKYLREIAERQAIDQYTTAEIHLVMQNENHISSDADLDGIINELEKRTEEAILAVSEGAHV